MYFKNPKKKSGIVEHKNPVQETIVEQLRLALHKEDSGSEELHDGPDTDGDSDHTDTGVPSALLCDRPDKRQMNKWSKRPG